MFGLLSVDRLLHHPVSPQALCWAADHAGDGGAASDLAIAAHFIALSQALLLGGACLLPGHDEVAQCDVHLPISLDSACEKILFAVSLQINSTHYGGGSCVEGIDILVGPLEHLKLLDVILDSFNGVSIDVITNLNLFQSK